MTMDSDCITIDYYSDVLCIWAWITQRRIDELNKHFDDKINIRYFYVDIFGDATTRINQQWSDKGLYEGFADHVESSVAPYEFATVHNDIWSKVRPTTSSNPHMVLKAIEIAHSEKYAIDFSCVIRKAFFLQAIDISNLDNIFKLMRANNIDVDPVKALITDGQALAALMCDYQKASQYQIKGSPCFVMNEGRQILFGNVGYRVLRINIEEILNKVETDASWC
jgi:predicted DsbA family dithiol-disulfide isomerase